MFGDRVAEASVNTPASVTVSEVPIPNRAYTFICVHAVVVLAESISALMLSFES